MSQSQDERTALHIASQEGHDHVVELLLQAGANVDQEAKVRSRLFCNGSEYQSHLKTITNALNSISRQ